MNPAFEPADKWLAAREGLEMARRDCLEAGDSDEEITLYGLAQSEAGTALMLTPAPDAAALAHKLAVFRDEEIYRLDNIGDVFEALIADVLRLATEDRFIGELRALDKMWRGEVDPPIGPSAA